MCHVRDEDLVALVYGYARGFAFFSLQYTAAPAAASVALVSTRRFQRVASSGRPAAAAASSRDVRDDDVETIAL